MEGSEGGEEDEVPLVGAMRPCVCGLSFAVGGDARVDLLVEAAYYEREEGEKRRVRWRRHAIQSPRIKSTARNHTNFQSLAPWMELRFTCGLRHGRTKTPTWLRSRWQMLSPSRNSLDRRMIATLFQVKLIVSPTADSPPSATA